MLPQLVIWYLLLLLLGLVGLPIAWLLLGHLPDHGCAFSRALGLLFVGYSAWLLTILGFTHFGASVLIFLILCLGAAGWGVMMVRRPRGLTTLRLRWRDLLGYEVLFLAALLFMTWLRTFDPHPQGTERPMDYAFFNAIMRSQTFPPHDPWLSGYAINYYYFGYLLMGVPTLLSGLDPGVGYNLSLTTLFALTAVHLASLVHNLVALSADRQGSGQGRGLLKPLAALLGVTLVLVAGNQAGVLQVLARTEQVVALDARQTWVAIRNGLWGDPHHLHLPYATPQTSDFGVIQDLALSDMRRSFNWWWPSRALWDDYEVNGVPHRRYNITEFPFFSFYLGDMHPHVMALPFTVLVAALALALMGRGRVPRWWRSDRSGRLSLGLHAIILGSLYFLNSWDLPTYALLMVGALLWVHVRTHGADDHRHWRNLLAQAGTLLVASIALYLPFYATFRSFTVSSDSLLLGRIPLFGLLLKTVGIAAWSKSSLHQIFIIFGLFLVPIAVYMAHVASHVAWRSPLQAHKAGARRLAQLGRSHTVWRWMILITFALGLALNFPLLGLLPVVVYALLISLNVSEVPTAFAYLGIALAAFLLFSTDVFYIRDIFGNRMNTVFKFYYQVWTLGGILAAYAIWTLLQRFKGSPFIWLMMPVFGVLLAGALVYPALAIQQRTKGISQGLRGLTAREMRSQSEREAVAWLRAHAPPDAVVLEAVGTSYDGTGIGAGGISGATGLQTVLGWPGHENQWRVGDPAVLPEIATRQADVQTIYTSRDLEKVQTLLEKYDIRYVVVGDSEYQTYPGLSTRVFERLMMKVFISADRKVMILARPR